MADLDRLVKFPEARVITGCSSNATLRKLLKRFNIEPIELSCRWFTVKESDLKRLLRGEREVA